MASNTKLTVDQKTELKIMRINAKQEGLTITNNGQTTIAYKVKGNTVRFSTSVKSMDETKFRRKVGEFHALMRSMYNNYAVLNTTDFANMMISMDMPGYN